MKGNTYRQGKKPTNAFSDGHEPWNKDVKGLHLSPETEFTKGYKSHKRVPVGTVAIRKCKGGSRRAFVKVADPNLWKLRSVVVWEEHNGPLPCDKVVHHKDRNPLNDSYDNLAALTRKEHLEEHRNEFRR